MNIKQQLNNSFFALFIGALLIGARDTDNFENFGLQRILFFLFLFFFKLKMYLDDNNNFSNSNLKMSSERTDFAFGYITTIISWVFFPIAAYRIWDTTIEYSIIWLFLAVFFLSQWTISVAFIVKPNLKEHVRWFYLNLAYLIALTFLYFVTITQSMYPRCYVPGIVTVFSYIFLMGLIGILYYDTTVSDTINNAKK